MRLISARGGPAAGTWSFTQALLLGQAPDGGLFVPDSLSRISNSQRARLLDATFPDRALVTARHFLGDEMDHRLLRTIVHDALDFPVPLREIEPGIFILELFHGPTHAFKDIGARFMARAMAALRSEAAPPLTILTATSGDTGGAVAHAFHGLPNVRVVVLYPLGKVSPRQEAQFATLGGNVTAVAVRGTFDDCQRLARQAFADPDLSARTHLTSANSINIGRLLPQTFYYVHAWAELSRVAPGAELVISVPSGNLGNLTAGLVARHVLGMSRTGFVAATNANAIVPEYLDGHGYNPRPSVATISSAMDVGSPSNFRRIAHMFAADSGTRANVPRDLLRALVGSSWTDRQTRACIRDLWERRGIAIDPHTAVGLLGLRHEVRKRPGGYGVVLGTAHPAKFAETVEPLIGETVPVPPGIVRVMDRPRRSIRIPPDLEALRGLLVGAAPAHTPITTPRDERVPHAPTLRRTQPRPDRQRQRQARTP